MKHHFMRASLPFVACIFAAASLFAQDRQVKRLIIPSGKTTISAKGSITGYQDIDYLISAGAGQTITVTLKSNKTSNYFLVYSPYDRETAMYNSDAGSQTWTKTLDKSGDYTIRVYLFRNAARNNVKADFTISVGLKNANAAPAAKTKPATPKFTATSVIQAALLPTAPMGSTMADVGVVRYGNGDADIYITNANGQKRVFNFAKGVFQCVTPKGCKVDWERTADDDWKVTFNDTETYLIVDAIITGG